MGKYKQAWIYLICATILCSCGKDDPTTEAIPRLSIADVAQAEGNTNKIFEFVVSLSNTYSKPVSVKYSTIAGTAKSGADFIAVTDQVLTIEANQSSGKILITVIGDDIREGNDEFLVRLTSPVNATISRESATGTIQNDDLKVGFSNNGYDAPDSYPGYELVWSDEFNGSALDAGSWVFDAGDGCPGLCGWGNNELQYYTNSPDNLFFQDGKLIIEARKESYGGKNYTSSRIKTAGKKAWTFGRIDIRAKLPEGRGIWPAFWMLPQESPLGQWPTSGEIDIMELIGSEPKRSHGTVHFGPGPGSTQISRSFSLDEGKFSEQFHVFSLEWKENEIQWLIDGNLFSTVRKSDLGTSQYPFNEPFYLLINLAVGGNWPGAPDADTYFPQHLIVDYVRIYQQD